MSPLLLPVKCKINAKTQNTDGADRMRIDFIEGILIDIPFIRRSIAGIINNWYANISIIYYQKSFHIVNYPYQSSVVIWWTGIQKDFSLNYIIHSK